jgi:hypothetical protein
MLLDAGGDGSSDSGPEPQAFVYATLAPTNGGSCAGIASLTSFLTIGTGAGGDVPTRVPNGGTTQVACSVTSTGSTYQVSLSATSDSTTTGGSLTISGTDISGTTGATDLIGVFDGVNTEGQYSANDCALAYATSEGLGGIAPGRIWGHLECDGATNGSVTVSGGLPSTCDVTVDFIFENCGQ